MGNFSDFKWLKIVLSFHIECCYDGILLIDNLKKSSFHGKLGVLLGTVFCAVQMISESYLCQSKH